MTPAELAYVLDDRDLARVVYPSLQPIAEQVGLLAGGLVCFGAFGYHAGLVAATLGRRDEAARHFEHALALNARLGARSYAVRTQRAYADLLLQRDAPGDADRAAELVGTALAEAEVLGLTREVVRLNELGKRLALH